MKKEAEAKKVLFLCYSGHQVHAYVSALIIPIFLHITSIMPSRAPASLCPSASLWHFVHIQHVHSGRLLLQAAEDREVAKRLEQVQQLPQGQKKDYGAEMLKGYDPKYVEAAT